MRDEIVYASALVRLPRGVLDPLPTVILTGQ